MDIRYELLESISAAQTEPTFALVRVGTNNCQASSLGIFLDCVCLVFRRILLMVSRHANVLRRTSGQRECPLTSKLYFTTAHNAHSHSRLSDTNGSGETIRISVAALTSTCAAALVFPR